MDFIIPRLKFFKKKSILAVAVLVIIGCGYLGYRILTPSQTAAQYITTAAEKGTLTESVNGTGQVSSSDQIDIKPQVGGKIIRVTVRNEQEVKKGDLLVQLDAQDAQKAVRDAETSLQSAQLALQKLRQPADSLSLVQAQNSLESAQNVLEKLELSQPADYQKAKDASKKAQDNLVKAYDDSFTDISETFLDLPTIISKLHDVLYSYEISQSGVAVAANSWNTIALVNSVNQNKRDVMQQDIDKAAADYDVAKLKYDQSFVDYKNIDRSSSPVAIETTLAGVLDATKSIAQAAKSANDMLNAWGDYRTQYEQPTFSKVTDYQTVLSTDIQQTSSHLATLLSQQRTLQDDKEAVNNAGNDLGQMEQNGPLDLAAAEQSIKEKEASLEKLRVGADPLDIQSQQLAVKQKENALLDARQKLADYGIKSPLDGVVASVDAKVGDQASAASALATVITKQKVAKISLNEVDVAKIKIGQKATLSFDAVDSLSLTGEVAEIDAVGTVSQGVVSYNIKIIFDTQDERIKPGMSVTASVITSVEQNVLIVPSPAVKTQGSQNYVEVLKDGASQQKAVQVGLSNDSQTEIVSGIDEGEAVITQTISTGSSPKTTASAQPSGQRTILQEIGGGSRGIGGR